MSNQLSLTQKWLRQNVQPYPRSDVVYTHVDAALAAFPTLRPKTDVYTFDDGRSQLLLSIHGLLPILFRRASYNIPLMVWLTLEYPAQPPLVYVVPTSDMLVKAGKFVDVSGRCEPSYIQAWQKKSEGCNLTSLMEALTEQFSKEPPVYAKPKSPSPPPRPRETVSSPRTPNYSNRPPPPAPGSPRSNGHPPSPPPGFAPAPPGPPPNIGPHDRPSTRSPPPPPPPPPPIARHSHPPSQNSYHRPRPATSTSVQDPPKYNTSPSHRYAHTAPSAHFRGPPAHLSFPPVQDSSRVGVQTEPTPLLHQRRSMAPTSIQAQYIGQPAPPLPSTSHPQIPLQPPLSAPPLMQQQPAPPPPQPVTPPVAPTPVHNFLEEDEAVLQPTPPPSNAPPRPPNPEVLRLHAQVHTKLTSERVAFEQAVMSDTERLRAAQSDLLAGEPAIRDEMARLEAVRDVCTVVANRLRTTVERAEANLVELRRKGDPEVDELICSTTIVYNQLIDLVAEDNAIEDTIYHLHRALNAGRIDLDKFLRTTRALAEEQFMKRALAQKIVASMPLGAWRQ